MVEMQPEALGLAGRDFQAISNQVAAPPPGSSAPFDALFAAVAEIRRLPSMNHAWENPQRDADRLERLIHDLDGQVNRARENLARDAADILSAKAEFEHLDANLSEQAKRIGERTGDLDKDMGWKAEGPQPAPYQ